MQEKNSLISIISFVLLGLVIGFLGIIHLRSSSARTINISQSNFELNKMVLSLERQQQDLKKQTVDLEKQVSADQENIKSFKNISTENIDNLKKAKTEAGLIAQEGKGVVITLDDSQVSQNGNTAAFLIHDSDLRDLVNLLWLADAKACSINNERITFATSIDCLVNTILVNNDKLGPSYKISAIVDQDKIKSLLGDDTYLADFKKRVHENNLIFNTEYKDKIEIPAYSSSLLFNYLN